MFQGYGDHSAMQRLLGEESRHSEFPHNTRTRHTLTARRDIRKKRCINR